MRLLLLGKGAVLALRFERPLAAELDESEQRCGPRCASTAAQIRAKQHSGSAPAECSRQAKAALPSVQLDVDQRVDQLAVCLAYEHLTPQQAQTAWVRQGILTLAVCQAILTAMARYGGGAETYRALRGPRRAGDKGEVLYTFTSIRNVRAKIDRSELVTVREARRLGMSWTEIATALGVTRQAAWERFHEMDLDGAAESPITIQRRDVS